MTPKRSPYSFFTAPDHRERFPRKAPGNAPQDPNSPDFKAHEMKVKAHENLVKECRDAINEQIAPDVKEIRVLLAKLARANKVIISAEVAENTMSDHIHTDPESGRWTITEARNPCTLVKQRFAIVSECEEAVHKIIGPISQGGLSRDLFENAMEGNNLADGKLIDAIDYRKYFLEALIAGEEARHEAFMTTARALIAKGRMQE